MSDGANTRGSPQGKLDRMMHSLRRIWSTAPVETDAVPTELSAEESPPSIGPTRVVIEPKPLLEAIASVATAVWRTRKRLAGVTEMPDDLRNLPRHLDSAWDSLRSAQVEVRDQTGERYVTGMALKVISFQPTEGLGAEVIQETIKPSVYYKDMLIQRGEVIVGTPPIEPAPDADAGAAEMNRGEGISNE